MLLSLLQPARQGHLLIAVSATAPILVNPLVLQPTWAAIGVVAGERSKGCLVSFCVGSNPGESHS